MYTCFTCPCWARFHLVPTMICGAQLHTTAGDMEFSDMSTQRSRGTEVWTVFPPAKGQSLSHPWLSWMLWRTNSLESTISQQHSCPVISWSLEETEPCVLILHRVHIHILLCFCSDHTASLPKESVLTAQRRVCQSTGTGHDVESFSEWLQVVDNTNYLNAYEDIVQCFQPCLTMVGHTCLGPPLEILISVSAMLHECLGFLELPRWFHDS